LVGQFWVAQAAGVSSAIQRMSKNEEQWIKIAEGGDGYNTYWDGEFAPVMEQIERYIYAIDEYQLDRNWKEICDSVPVLRDKGWHTSNKI
jgi:hypothetical protein